MRWVIGVSVVLAVLLGSVCCTKVELKENEIIGVWDSATVAVDVAFRDELSEATKGKYSTLIQLIFGSVFGSALQSFECLPNNELRINSFDLTNKKDIILSGIYYYRPGEQFSMEADVRGNADLGYKMVLFGGMVGMQYMPVLEGNELILSLDRGVALALARVLLHSERLHELYTISEMMSILYPDENKFKEDLTQMQKEMEGMELEVVFSRVRK